MGERNNILVGTQLKIAVRADLGDVHMSEVDFECRFYSNFKPECGVTVKKSGMAYVSSDEYLAVVDTKAVGAGEYLMNFTAQIPDPDVDGGLRTEKVCVPTGILVTL